VPVTFDVQKGTEINLIVDAGCAMVLQVSCDNMPASYSMAQYTYSL